MVRGGVSPSERLRRDIARHKHVGGAAAPNGGVIAEPVELSMSKMVDALCQRYGVLPSQLLNEDVSLLKMVRTVTEGEPDGDR